MARVTLGNISHILLNLTKTLIFAMFKDSSPPLNVHVVNSHVSSSIHQLRMLLALTFFPFPYLSG